MNTFSSSQGCRVCPENSFSSAVPAKDSTSCAVCAGDGLDCKWPKNSEATNLEQLDNPMIPRIKPGYWGKQVLTEKGKHQFQTQARYGKLYQNVTQAVENRLNQVPLFKEWQVFTCVDPETCKGTPEFSHLATNVCAENRSPDSIACGRCIFPCRYYRINFLLEVNIVVTRWVSHTQVLIPPW